MEDTLRGIDGFLETYKKVLILVLMEDTLRVIKLVFRSMYKLS